MRTGHRRGAVAVVSRRRAQSPLSCSCCDRALITGPFDGPRLDAADAGQRVLCLGCLETARQDAVAPRDRPDDREDG